MHALRLALALLLLGAPSPALATTFGQGSLIVPMDTSFQDSGMLQAFGLVYQLLKAGVPVHWVIKENKSAGDTDFSASATDVKTGAAVSSHGYRGGPFVVESQYAAAGLTVVTAWQAGHTTTVHKATADFTARTARLLTAAPSIAVIADGNEDIAFGYLNAAGIPDRKGSAWSKTSPDVLTITAIAGPTTTKHDDGALFRSSGQPAYCQVMTMHWGVKEVVDEVVAEYRAFLGFPTHMMAECQAVNAIENNKFGRFLTPNGFLIDNNVKASGPFAFPGASTPFAQLDGTFNLVGGSEQAYSLPTGDKYHDLSVVMIKDAATAVGQRSIWMTGYIDGKCTITDDDVQGKSCKAGVGKISYLGGHRYDVKLPISQNPTTQGTRLFLNSLLEASCATDAGQPSLSLGLSGPGWTADGKISYTLTYSNLGPGPALDMVLTDVLPAGVTFGSASNGGTAAGQTVTWKLGDLAAKASGSLTLSVTMANHGIFTNLFAATYTVGLNSLLAKSNAVTTRYSATPPADLGALPDGDGLGDGSGPTNPGSGEGDDTGCSCRAAGSAPAEIAVSLLGLLLLGLALARRRGSQRPINSQGRARRC